MAAGVPEFVANFVTDGRGEQGLSKISENGEKPTKAQTAKFIQWMVADVKKESAVELEVCKVIDALLLLTFYSKGKQLDLETGGKGGIRSSQEMVLGACLM